MWVISAAAAAAAAAALLLQGVDYWTIHAGVLLRHIPLTAHRITGGHLRIAGCMRKIVSTRV
jgi:thiamine biosynthesis protein ThiC